MKTVEYYARGNRSGNLLHIETDGAVVNIHVGLSDNQGRQVTSVQIIPDDERRGGDGEGRMWHVAADSGPANTRIIQASAPPPSADLSFTISLDADAIREHFRGDEDDDATLAALSDDVLRKGAAIALDRMDSSTWAAVDHLYRTALDTAVSLNRD